MPRDRYSRGHLARTKSKPPKWTGDWYVYLQVEGKEKRVHRGPIVFGKCSEMSKAEAQAELDRRIAEDRNAADQKPSGDVTLDWLLRQYLELKKPSWSDATAESAMYLFAAKLIPAFAGRTAKSITRADLQGYLNGLATAGASYSLVSKAKLYLKAVFADAVEDDHIEKDPARKLEMPRTKKSCTRYLTPEECSKLLDVVSGRDRIVIRMCMVQGLRPSEIFGLKRSDIEANRICIQDSARNGKLQNRTKTKDSTGYVALPPSLAFELEHWLTIAPEDPSGLVFPSAKAGVPMRQGHFLARNLKPAGKRAGIEGVTFQALRRTTATHVPGVGGSVKDAQAILRHSTPQMTAGKYMQAIDESVIRAVEALDEKLCKGRVN